MVFLLHLGCLHQALMIVENRLRKSRSPRGKIDGRVVLLFQTHQRRLTGTICHQFPVTLRESRTSVSHIDQQASPADPLFDKLDTPDKFRTEEQYMNLCQLHAVGDLVSVKAEIERHRNGSGLQDSEVDGQPLQTVEHENRYPIPSDPPASSMFATRLAFSSKTLQVISRR